MTVSRTVDHTDLFILRTVCDELSPIESIMARARSELPRDEVDAIPTRLLRLIGQQLINSYLLHAERPFVSPVETDAEGIHRYWFFISKAGLKLLMDSTPDPKPSNVVPPHRFRHMRGKSSRPRNGPSV